MANKISVLIDVAVDNANRSLKSFRQSIADADGAAGKFKAGISGAFSAVQANAGNLAMAGAAALIGFGTKAVGAFQETALEAGKLRDSLGLTAEQASKFMEVAGDLGIEVGTFEASIGKMNQTAARSPQLFDDIGASLVKNADGTDNVEQNFLNVIDALNAMPSANARADAAQRIFGKNWREISEMIGRGSGELKRNLEQVGDAKIINDDEVDKARKFRDVMDELSDVGEELMLSVGEPLVAALTDVAEAAGTVADVATAVTNVDMPGWLDAIIDKAEEALNPLSRLEQVWQDWKDLGPLDEWVGITPTFDELDSVTKAFLARMYTMQSASRDLGDAAAETGQEYVEFGRGMQDAAADTAELIEEVNDLVESMFDGEQSAIEFQQSIDDLRQTEADTNKVLADGKATAEEKSEALRNLRLDQISVAEGALAQAQAYATEQGAVEGSTAATQKQIDYLSMLKGQYPEIAADIDKMIDALLEVPGTTDPFGAGFTLGGRLGEGVQAGITDRSGAVERAAEILVEKALIAAGKKVR